MLIRERLARLHAQTMPIAMATHNVAPTLDLPVELYLHIVDMLLPIDWEIDVQNECPICKAAEDNARGHDGSMYGQCCACGQMFCGECKPLLLNHKDCPACRAPFTADERRNTARLQELTEKLEPGRRSAFALLNLAHRFATGQGVDGSNKIEALKCFRFAQFHLARLHSAGTGIGVADAGMLRRWLPSFKIVAHTRDTDATLRPEELNICPVCKIAEDNACAADGSVHGQCCTCGQMYCGTCKPNHCPKCNAACTAEETENAGRLQQLKKSLPPGRTSAFVLLDLARRFASGLGVQVDKPKALRHFHLAQEQLARLRSMGTGLGAADQKALRRWLPTLAGTGSAVWPDGIGDGKNTAAETTSEKVVQTSPAVLANETVSSASLTKSTAPANNDHAPLKTLLLDVALISSKHGGKLKGPFGVLVEIRPGAIERDLLMALSYSELARHNRDQLNIVTPVIEVLPHGIQFTEPARVTLPHAVNWTKAAADAYTLCAVSEIDGKLESHELPDSLEMSDRSVTFEVKHFSKRAVSVGFGRLLAAGAALTVAAVGYAATAYLQSMPTTKIQAGFFLNSVESVCRIIFRLHDLGLQQFTDLEKDGWVHLVQLCPDLIHDAPGDSQTIAVEFEEEDSHTKYIREIDGIPTSFHTEVSFPLVDGKTYTMRHRFSTKSGAVVWKGNWTYRRSGQITPISSTSSDMLSPVPIVPLSPSALFSADLDGRHNGTPSQLTISVLCIQSMSASGGVDLSRSQLEEMRDMSSEFDKAGIKPMHTGISTHFKPVNTLEEALNLLEDIADVPPAASELRILHFAGHGEKTLQFEDVDPEIGPFAHLIIKCKPDCVIFNACNTRELAEGTAAACQIGSTKHAAPLVVFWDSVVETKAGCETFARRFYRRLGKESRKQDAGNSVTKSAMLQAVYTTAKDFLLANKTVSADRADNQLRCSPFDMPVVQLAQAPSCTRTNQVPGNQSSLISSARLLEEAVDTNCTDSVAHSNATGGAPMSMTGTPLPCKLGLNPMMPLSA